MKNKILFCAFCLLIFSILGCDKLGLGKKAQLVMPKEEIGRAHV